MKTKMVKTLLTLSVAGLMAACSSSNETPEVSASEVIKQAVSSSHRAEQSQRDEYRHPQQTLEFFGLEPDMTVVEIWPGGGWYTSILNPIVKDQGKLYAAHFYTGDGTPEFMQKSVSKFKEKVNSEPMYAGIEVTEFDHANALNVAPAGSADMVLTFRNVHNWYMRGGDQGVDAAFMAFNEALKKGGVLGLVDHRLPESLDQETYKRSGYMKQSYVVAAAERAGFKLVASSEVNANPKDDSKHPRGVWTLPPRLALGEEDKAKYLAIGESDRMTLKFEKL